MTGRQKLILVITAFTFALLVFSVIPWDSIIGFESTDPITHETVENDYWWNLGWWFPELTALFLVAAVVVGLVAGFSEKEITGNIARGFGDFIGAGIAVMLARGVTVILNNTQTIDTILSWMEDAVSGTDRGRLHVARLHHQHGDRVHHPVIVRPCDACDAAARAARRLRGRLDVSSSSRLGAGARVSLGSSRRRAPW